MTQSTTIPLELSASDQAFLVQQYVYKNMHDVDVQVYNDAILAGDGQPDALWRAVLNCAVGDQLRAIVDAANAVTVTDSATAMLAEYVASNEVILIGVATEGCAGKKFTLTTVNKDAHPVPFPQYIAINCVPNATVVYEMVNFGLIGGSILDYDAVSKSFIITNPKFCTVCACGSSFKDSNG